MTQAALNALARGDIDNAIVAMTPGGIERSEKRGQEQFVAASELPRKRDCTQAYLESLGFVFCDKNTDTLFIECTMPIGWKKVATDHSMWSELLDNKNRKRASMFYKAAFYDRDAFLRLCPFYRVETVSFLDGKVFEWDRPGQPTHKQLRVVNAEGAVLLETPQFEYRDHEAEDFANLQCREYLNETHPNWVDCTAYWD